MFFAILLSGFSQLSHAYVSPPEGLFDIGSMLVFICAVAVFCLSFFYLRVVSVCNSALGLSKNAIKIITDKTLDDISKEKAIQKLALSMLKKSFSLFLRMMAVFLLTLIPFLLADTMDIVSYEKSSRFAMRLDVLFISTILILAIIFVRNYFIRR